MSISVIIPVKNRAELLKKTLDNILAQTLKPSEIIVVDDQSTDGIEDVQREYFDRVIFMKNSGVGPGAARNTGFLASTGSYIQFFDSDDLMTLDKLEIQFNQLENSTSMMAYCPHVKAIEDQNEGWKQRDTILYFHPFSKRLRYDQWLIRGACMVTQSCLFKRELIENAGLWRTDLMPHEDLEFLFRIGQVEPYPIHSNIPAVIYRQHAFQITDKSTTINSRAIDQLNAYCFIKENMMKNKNYTFFDQRVLEINLLRSSTFVPKELWSHDISGIHHSIRNRVGYKIEKAVKKFQRIVTHSDWIFLHGVNNDPKQFQQYIQKLV